MADLVFLTVVPVAHPAKIAVPHVTARDLTDNLTSLLDLAPEVVLLLEKVAIVRKLSLDVVFYVSIDLVAVDLVAERPHEQTVHSVLRVVASDTAAIFENYFPLAEVLNVS